MGHALAQVRMRRGNGLLEDVIVNTFHFETAGTGVTLADGGSIAAQLEDFYRTTPTGGIAVQGYLSQLLETAAGSHQIRVYDMNQPEPRVPVFTAPLSLTPGTAMPLPAEVAVCLSFEATPQSGINQARRRGRIYLGPLTSGTLAFDTSALEGTTGDQRVNPPFITSLLAAADRLMVVGPITTSPAWSVYSSVSNALVRVAQASVDNAFDTQRRRGSEPTVRSRIFATP